MQLRNTPFYSTGFSYLIFLHIEHCLGLFLWSFYSLRWCALMAGNLLPLLKAIQHSINSPFAFWQQSAPGTWQIPLFLLCQSIMNHPLITAARPPLGTADAFLSTTAPPVKLNLHKPERDSASLNAINSVQPEGQVHEGNGKRRIEKKKKRWRK